MSASRTGKKSRLMSLSFLTIMILLSALSIGSLEFVARVHAPTTSANPLIAINNASNSTSNSFIDLAHTSSQFNMIVNVTNGPSISGFAVEVKYNPNVLSATSIDDSAGVLTLAAQAQGQVVTRPDDCYDGQGPACSANPDNGPGTASLTAITPANTTSRTTGQLFTISFTVKDQSSAFSQMQINSAKSALSEWNGTATIVLDSSNGLRTVDGYYTSLDCPRGSGVPCVPPRPAFRVMTKTPSKKAQTVFNASASLPSPGASITDYHWNWIPQANTFGYVDTFTNSTAVVEFPIAGRFLMTLKVTDSNGIFWSVTQPVDVVDTTVDIGISEITVRPVNKHVLPGTTLIISATVTNYSFMKENVSLLIRVENKILNQTDYPRALPSQGELSLTAKWDTAGYTPKVYRVDAYAPPLTNSTNGKIIETNVDNNLAFIWVQVVSPTPIGFQLGLWPTLGLGIVSLGAVAYSIARVRRRALPSDLL